MITIFVPEYILFIEEVNFSPFLDVFMLNPDVIFFQDVTVNFSSYRTPIKSNETVYISKTREWVYTTFLIGRRLKFVSGYDLTFISKTIKKWFWWWSWWGSIPKQNIYNNFSNLNFLVGKSFVNHEFVSVATCDYRLVDCFLLRNHSTGVYNSEWVKLFENRNHAARFVVYRSRPFARELFTQAIVYYRPALFLAINNPQCIYFDDGLLYARKWVVHVYMTLSSYRMEPFYVYGYWTSEYFPSLTICSESFLGFEDKYLNSFLYLFHDFNFLYILWFFLFCYMFFFYFILFLYFYDDNKFYEIVLPGKILTPLYNFTWNFTVLYNAKKKQIRIDKLEFRNEYGLKSTKKRHFESRFFNFVNKRVFSRIIVSYWKWLSIDSQYYQKFKSGDYKLSYIFVLLLFFLINTISELLFFPKTVVYYLHYMYHLWLPRYFRNYLHINFRNKFSFDFWFTSFVTHGREFYENTAFEAVTNFMNYLKLYSKAEYKRHIREKIIEAYEAKMWGLEVDPEKKEEYINFYFYKIFSNYYPDNDFFNVLFPRFFSRLFYSSDFSFNKIYTQDFAEFFSGYSTKFGLLKSKKGLLRFFFLSYFFSFNFWRLYFYFYYMLYNDKVDKADNLIKIYFLYVYTCLIYAYSLWNKIISVVMTKNVLIRYFFKHYLFFSYSFFNKFVLYNIIFKILYVVSIFLFIPLLLMLYLYDLARSYIVYFFYSMKNRMLNLSEYLFVSNRGYGYNFWYNYYTFKFYFTEHNFLLPLFIRIFYFIVGVVTFLFILYLVLSLPIFTDFIFGDKMFKVFYFFSERLDIYVKYFHLNYSLNRWRRFYLRSSVLFNGYFEVFVNYYDRKYAYLNHDVNFESLSFFHLRPFAKYYVEHVERFSDFLELAEEKKFKFGPFNFVKLHYWLFPGLPPWWLFFWMHLYLKFFKEPMVIMMPDFYWIHLPVLVTWFGTGYYSVFPIVLMPIAWFLNNFYALVTFNLLYWTYNTPFYYIFFFVLKGLYSFYLFIVYECFYTFYYYYYYKLWIVISDYFFTFHMDEIRFGLRKYSVLRFLIALDLYNIFKLSVNSLFFIINNSVIYFMVNLYKSFASFFSIFGFNFVGSVDYFSLNFLPSFRPFAADLYDIVLPSNYDLQEYNSVFSEHVQNRTGRNRRYHLKHHKLNPYLSREKYKLHALEFKVRGFLVYDSYYLLNMALIPHLIAYRSNSLLFYILPSIYIFFFMFVFFFAFLYVKYSHFLRESRHYYNSATYEWQMFTKRQKRIELGYDEYYWLYNIRWLRTFEFYWDKCFQDDLFASYYKNEDILGFELVNKLNEMLLQTDSKYALGNTYFKLRRYYFDKYILFIRDIDYFFKIFSVRKHQLGKRWRIYSKYNFFFPLFEKVSNEFNYGLQYSFLTRENRMDYFWAHFITSYFLREKSRVDNLNFSNHRELYDSIRKSLFKAYAVFEMNQKDFPFDLFEFQFFEPEFFSELYENFASYDLGKNNNVLRKIIYSRSNTVLLYSALSEAENVFGVSEYDKKINDFFLYLDGLNKRFFNGFIDFGPYIFMTAFSDITTNISPDIAKTAVDIDRGDLIGVSYKKSMLLDEFTSTEITEDVFASVDYFFSKTKFNNMDMYKVFLKEETVTTNKPISVWWLFLVLMPFYVFYIELDSMFKYGRYITPQSNFVDIFQYIVSHLFNERISNRLMWIKHFAADFVNWTKKLKYQVKTAHFRSVAWEVRWIELASFWTGNNSILPQSKLDYSWFLVRLFNDHGGYYKMFSAHFADFYIRGLLGWRHVFKLFVILKFFQFSSFVAILYLMVSTFFWLQNSIVFFHYDDSNVVEQVKPHDKLVGSKHKNAFKHFEEELAKHRQTADFIKKYKEDQIKKKQIEEARRTEREIEGKRDRWAA